jgi:hypothetical protein
MGANRLSFVAGLAIGFVAGTRAGRERYDQMMQAAKTAKDSPTFQQAAGKIQTQASGLLSSAGQKAPGLAQSAMHTVSDRVPLLKNRGSEGTGNGKSADSHSVPASGNGHSKSSHS